MATQSLIVLLLVLGCSLYALWTLMPAVARRFLAQRLLRLPLPAAWATIFLRAVKQPSGCDCSGCDKVVDLQRQPGTQVVRFHPQRKP
ncbi:MAG: hypothetical protein WA136_11960 [Rhodoferax sp.]